MLQTSIWWSSMTVNHKMNNLRADLDHLSLVLGSKSGRLTFDGCKKTSWGSKNGKFSYASNRSEMVQNDEKTCFWVPNNPFSTNGTLFLDLFWGTLDPLQEFEKLQKMAEKLMCRKFLGNDPERWDMMWEHTFENKPRTKVCSHITSHDHFQGISGTWIFSPFFATRKLSIFRPPKTSFYTHQMSKVLISTPKPAKDGQNQLGGCSFCFRPSYWTIR